MTVKAKETKEKSKPLTYYALVFLLAIRAIGQLINFINAAGAGNIIFIGIFTIFGLFYITAFIGVIKKQKWGPLIAVVITLIDLVLALIIGGVYSLGAGIVDITILFLAYKEYQRL